MKVHELFEEEEKSILNTFKRHPKNVKGNFLCTYKSLDSLEGAPLTVDGYFDCGANNLKSFKYSPHTVLGLACFNLNKIKSLEGAPSYIGKDFRCFNNKLTSLHNIHKHIKHIGGEADLRYNPIKSHVLGLLLIDGLKKVYLDNEKVQVIINDHLKGDRDVFACQEELIDNGFEDYAQL